MAIKKVLGIVNLHSNSSLGEITARRPIASTSLLGRYSFIDFALSNFTNSQIADIGVLIREKPRSLFRHLGMGKEWNLNTKIGGIMLLYNEKYANNNAYNHDINNLLENQWVLDSSPYEYVIVAPCHLLYRIDYRPFVEAFEQSHAEIGMAYKRVKDAKEHFIGASHLILQDGYVRSIKTNKGDLHERNISMEIYIMRLSKLKALMADAVQTSHFFSLRDIISKKVGEEKVLAYEYQGYLRCFDSTANYLKFSLELLQDHTFTSLFDPTWPIFTRTYDTPPAKYSKDAQIRNCFVANGAVIEGRAENCIIGRGVKIGKNSFIQDSIIFSNAIIEEDAHIENVIIDKEVQVKFIKDLKGSKNQPLVIKQGDVV